MQTSEFSSTEDDIPHSASCGHVRTVNSPIPLLGSILINKKYWALPLVYGPTQEKNWDLDLFCEA